jgi:hypothetical protein
MNANAVQDTNTELYLSSYVKNNSCEITHLFRYLPHAAA